MIDYAALRTELHTDPKNLGYTALITAGRDRNITSLLNSTTGNGAELQNVPSISKEQFLLGIASCYLVLPTLSADIQKKWDRILGVIQAANTVDVSSATVQFLLSVAVSDGLFDQATVDALSKYQASRSEVLFGRGVRIDDGDVSYALRGEF
jgi:hypothetical protein